MPRRPVHFGPEAMEEYGGLTPDPADLVEAAHQSAALVVAAGRDAASTERFIALVDEVGLSTLAELWSERPARSLPGVLWRLYVIREWIRRDPERASREYTAGMRFAEAHHAVAGSAEPPGPVEVGLVADEILRGVYSGNVATAFDRASAFCHVVASGRAELADGADIDDPADGTRQTTQAAAMQSTALDLQACARLWRAGELR
ncbi:hypothetical protein [Nostocoides sp. F2B08]|uniref:hypothetical protein n=1 Tax=Nostocoides sp. F2B08 TaxID=2653936 RepID=UPI001D04FEC3|nr:hypothetical protein [Tetrasphaera sp. F2B08]